MNKLTQQLKVERIKRELPGFDKLALAEIQKAIDDIKKVRSGNRTAAKDHDQLVEAYLKLQLNDNTKEREDGI